MPRKKKADQPESATQMIRTVRKATRKKYSPEEKIRIVRKAYGETRRWRHCAVRKGSYLAPESCTISDRRKENGS